MKIPLGQLLVRSGIITVKTLERALARQAACGKRLGRVLLEMGVLTEDELLEALGQQTQLLCRPDELAGAVKRHCHREQGGSDMKVLVVDDPAALNCDVEGALRREGYQVFTARDGVEGLRVAFSQKPDLILCDAAAPRMDGYALMRAVKANPSSAGTLMILLTSKASPEEEHRALKAGFHDFIGKPVMTMRVVSRVKRAFEIMDKVRELPPPPPA